MPTGYALAEVVGRLLLAHMFLLSGFNKITGYGATLAYMESAGVPGMVLPLVILLESGGALLLMFGWYTRWAALALGIFSALAAILFHADFNDQMQMTLWMKNWTIAGGMLVLFVHGAGRYSLDARFRRAATRAGSGSR